jgi:hypothetical protein
MQYAVRVKKLRSHSSRVTQVRLSGRRAHLFSKRASFDKCSESGSALKDAANLRLIAEKRRLTDLIARDAEARQPQKMEAIGQLTWFGLRLQLLTIIRSFAGLL